MSASSISICFFKVFIFVEHSNFIGCFSFSAAQKLGKFSVSGKPKNVAQKGGKKSATVSRRLLLLNSDLPKLC